MHPQKFLEQYKPKPRLTDADRAEKLTDLGNFIAGKRKEAVDARRASGIESVWLQCEEAYLGIDDMNRSEFSEARWAKPTSMSGPLMSNRVPDDDSRSTVYVRLTARYVDNAAAKLGEILFPIDDKAFELTPPDVPDLVVHLQNGQPVTDQMGQPVPHPQTGQPMTVADAVQQQLEQAKQSAEKAEKRIYTWMQEANYPAEGRKLIHDCARLGVGVLKGPYPMRKRYQAVTTEGGQVAMQIEFRVFPGLEWIDPWNFFPADGCGENIHDGDYVLERKYMSQSALRKLKQDGTYLPKQIDQVIAEGPGKVYTDGGRETQKDKHKNQFEVWYYYGVMTRDELEIALNDTSQLDGSPEDQDEFHVIATLVNDTLIKVTLNPFDSGRYPYNTICWSRRIGHWAGVGIAEQIKVPQKIVNGATRALLNNAGVSAGPQIVIDQLALEPADGNYRIYPNKIWYTTDDSNTQDVRAAFNAVEITNVQGPMQATIEYGMKLAEESTNIPLVTQGQDGETTPQTFGAAELQNSNAHTWLRSIGYIYDDAITEPVVEAYYEWLMNDPNVPDDEKGDFEINANGTNAMVERAIQEMVYQSLLQACANPAFELDPQKIMTEYLKSKRIDPRKVSMTPEQIAQQQQNPPPPPVQVQVAQVNAQAKIEAIQAQAQADMQQTQADMQHDQNMLSAGGMSPHMAQAQAKIAEANIRAQSAQAIESSRSQAELIYAQTEAQMARDNANADLQKMQMQRDIAILQYATQQKVSMDQVKAQLADRAMQEETKRQVAAASLQMQQNDRHDDVTQNAQETTPQDLARAT